LPWTQKKSVLRQQRAKKDASHWGRLTTSRPSPHPHPHPPIILTMGPRAVPGIPSSFFSLKKSYSPYLFSIILILCNLRKLCITKICNRWFQGPLWQFLYMMSGPGLDCLLWGPPLRYKALGPFRLLVRPQQLWLILKYL
jgi:hypothetical protein